MPVQLLITMTDDGNITVNGPIDNKLLSYGLLEAARDAIYDHNRKKQDGRRIIEATLVPPGH